MDNKNNPILSAISKHVPFIVLMIFYALIIASNIRIGYNLFDEGAALYPSVRILNGELPYRDFWAFYMPGQFYIVALLYKIFSVSVMTARLFGSIINFLLPVLAYLISIKTAGRKYAVFAPLLTVFSISVWGPSYACGSTLAVFAGLCSLYFFHKYISSKAVLPLLLSGALCGLAVFIRQDIGTYIFIAGILTLIAMAFYEKNASLINILQYLISFSVVLIVLSAYLLYNIGIKLLFENTFIYPLFVWVGTRVVAYPKFGVNFGSVPYYLPWLFYLFAALCLTLGYLKKRVLTPEKWIIINLIVTGIILFNYSRLRADNMHVLPFNVIAFILVPFLLSSIDTNNKYPMRVLKLLIMFLVSYASISFYGFAIRRMFVSIWFLPLLVITLIFMIVMVFGEQEASGKIKRWALKGIYILLLTFTAVKFYNFPLSQISSNILFGINTPYTVPSVFPRAKGILLSAGTEDSMSQAIVYIQQHTSPVEKIFVGNNNHDAIVINNILFYFLAERNCGTRYHELAPGVATTETGQKSIVSDIKNNSVRYIIIQKDLRLSDNTGKGSKYFDNFIRKNYETVLANEQFVVLFNKDPKNSPEL